MLPKTEWFWVKSHGAVTVIDDGSCDCSIPEVAAYFKSSTSVSYTFKEPYELNRNSSIQASSIYSDMTLRGENISLGFRTTQAPALLLYVGSYYREYLAVLLNRNGLENSLPPISPFISFHCSFERLSFGLAWVTESPKTLGCQKPLPLNSCAVN